jgi:8-oxo-dGTP pyrophosphatase MutT (NUDIX family)
MNKNTICNNCRKQGHLFQQCKLPITSYGIIVFKYCKQGIKYLMIRRKDSFGYIDFVRGKYSLYNLPQLMSSIDQMSIEEKHKLSTQPFERLWSEMWGDADNSQFKNEENISKKKHETLKNGFFLENGTFTNLNNLIELSQTQWTETEWEFPKGRRNQKEKDVECALREFEEETGISKNNLHLIENLLPFEETFIGSNHKSYKHKYFLAYLDNNVDLNLNLNCFQMTEVSKLDWKTLHECLESIRPYHLEKKELIKNVNKVLEEYRFY